ncbi:MAG: prefoldin subunit alpha [Nanoarchaeota archaeon]
MAQQNINEKYVELEMINQRLQELNTALQRIDTEIEHIHIAITTLDDLSSGDSTKELVIPIGAETFLTVTSDDVKTVKQSVGAGVIVERSSKQATSFLKNRIDTFKKEQEEYSNIYKQVIKKAETLQKEIEKDITTSTSS